MQDLIYIRDELVLEAHPQGDSPHILLRREGVPDSVPIYLNEARYPADAMCAMAAEIVGFVVGDEEPSRDAAPR